jgi:hypothetical protein
MSTPEPLSPWAEGTNDDSPLVRQLAQLFTQVPEPGRSVISRGGAWRYGCARARNAAWACCCCGWSPSESWWA